MSSLQFNRLFAPRLLPGSDCLFHVLGWLCTRNRAARTQNVDFVISKTELFQDFIIVLADRSEEHTSELQSQFHLVCRLLLEKKKKNRFTLLIVTPLACDHYSHLLTVSGTICLSNHVACCVPMWTAVSWQVHSTVASLLQSP